MAKMNINNEVHCYEVKTDILLTPYLIIFSRTHMKTYKLKKKLQECRYQSYRIPLTQHQ